MFSTEYAQSNDRPELWGHDCGDGESTAFSHVARDLPDLVSQHELTEHMRHVLSGNRAVFGRLCEEIAWSPTGINVQITKETQAR